MQQKVAIIILNWNSYDVTQDCLRSLSKIDIQGILPMVYVVDNASSDGSAEKLVQRFPDIQLLQNTDNLGFTGGNNVGITKGLEDGCDFFWILNNDTTVDRYSLSSLLDAMKDESVGIAVSKIYFSRGHEYHYHRYKPSQRGRVIWYAGGRIDWQNMYASHRGVDEVDDGQYNREEETEFATGCSFLIRKKVVKKIGMFDDRYFAYFEDIDLSLRVKRAGFFIRFVPDSIIWHLNAGSTSRPGNSFQQYYQTRNRFLTGMLYAPPRTKFALIREGVRLLIWGTKAQKQGISHAFLGVYGKQYLWKK